MLNDVVKVEHRGGYRLWLQFQDGVEGEKISNRLCLSGGYSNRSAIPRTLHACASMRTLERSVGRTKQIGDPLVLYSLVTGRPIESLLTPPGSA